MGVHPTVGGTSTSRKPVPLGTLVKQVAQYPRFGPGQSGNHLRTFRPRSFGSVKVRGDGDRVPGSDHKPTSIYHTLQNLNRKI